MGISGMKRIDCVECGSTCGFCGEYETPPDVYCPACEYKMR